MLFDIAPHPISNCSWRFTYIKILKYKYINILVTYKNNYIKINIK